MDGDMVILRLVHIFAGIFWVGGAVMMTDFIVPTARRIGPEGQPFMRGFLKHTRILVAMPVAALLTTVAGLLLYYRVSDHFNSDWMKSDAGVVLSIGALAGILAALVGGLVITPTTVRIRRLMDKIAERQGPPSDEQRAEMGRLQARNGRTAPLTELLLVIAVVGMAAARYV